MENLWILCWLLKDLGWVLLCGFVAWPAALGAILLQAHDVAEHVETRPTTEWAHSLATLGWLCGSSVWMTAQLLFDSTIHKSRTSPWYSGAIFTANDDHYHFGVRLMQAIDIVTLLGLLTFYVMRLIGDGRLGVEWGWPSPSSNPTGDAIRHRRQAALEDDEPEEHGSTHGLIFGMLTPEVYGKIFIVPWIVKDLFWCHQCFIPAVVCILLVTVLMADYLWLFKRWKNLAVLFWTTATAVWLCHDLVMHDSENWPLLLSILLFAVGTCIMSAVLVARPPYAYEEFRKGDAISKDEVVAML